LNLINEITDSFITKLVGFNVIKDDGQTNKWKGNGKDI
jgi:hypothetical protein